MKFRFTSAFFLFVIVSSFGKTITVNNNTNAIGMYSSAQEAIDASEIGDTIFLHSSATDYGNLTVWKRLTLIGEGYKNSTDGIAKYTKVGNVTLDSINYGVDLSGTTLIGFRATSLATDASTDSIHNITLINCYNEDITRVQGEGWSVVNCWLNQGILSSGGSWVDLSIDNSVLLGWNTYVSAYVDGVSIGYKWVSIRGFKGGVVNNCVLGNSMIYCDFMQFNNSIFGTTDKYAWGSTNILTIHCSFTAAQTIDAASQNAASNCLFEQDPFFVNTSDYQLSPEGATVGSSNPLLNAGNDGTDIGITGGYYPLEQCDGRVDLPQVHQVEVRTGVIAPGEDLIINVFARTRKK